MVWQFNMSPVLLVLIGVVLVLVLLAILVVAAMKEKSRRNQKTKNSANEPAPTKYDDIKKQPGISKDSVDKIFSYSIPEEKCPDIIPDVKGPQSPNHQLSKQEQQQPPPQVKTPCDVERNSWKEEPLQCTDDAQATHNGVEKYSRLQSPDTAHNIHVHIDSVKMQDFYPERDARLMQYQEYPTYPTTTLKGRQLSYRDTVQRSPFRDNCENVQTEV